MRIEAKVNDKWRFPTFTCHGTGFNKVDWVLVPVGGEDEVKENPYLDTRELVKKPAEKKQEATRPISPHASKLAALNNININAVAGTGKNGMVTKGDVEAYLKATQTEENTSEE